MASDPPVLQGLNYVRLLGRGGYAEVFLYEQTNPRMRVAVKILFAESLSARAREQFAAEANTMAELADHPNIVQVFRSDVTEDGRPYLVMKYYPQRNLAVRARAERLSVPEVLRIGVRVTCAVETAHRAGILHRDIKPANILTSQYGEPGLTDFGIATTSADADNETEGLSIPWSPPEVVFGTAPADRTADVYSLGATLWHILVGHSPFERPDGDNSSIAVMRRIRENPPPRTGRDDIPPSLERLLAQTMAKAPLDRPQTALQLARALQAIELEERWTPTPLVLLDVVDHENGEPGPPGAATNSDHEDRDDRDPETRARRPQGVAAQILLPQDHDDEPATRHRVVSVKPGPAASASPRSEPIAVERPGSRVRQGMPEPPDDPKTIRRPAVVPQSGAGSDAAPVGELTEDRENGAVRPAHRRRLIAVSVTLAAVVIGAGWFLASRGGNGTADTTTTLGRSTAPKIVAAPQSPDAPANVQGRRISASQVEFTWSIPDEKADDEVWWTDSGDASQSGVLHIVKANQAIVPATGEVCITVYVQSGTSRANSSPTCGGGS